VALQSRHRPGDRPIAHRPADPPAGHREGLGKAADHDRSLPATALEGTDHFSLEDEVFIDLVGDDPEVVLSGEGNQCFHLGSVIDGTGRVAGRVDDDSGGARSDELLEGLRRHPVTLIVARRNNNRDRIGKTDQIGEGNPVRCWQQHLVTWICKGEQRLGEGTTSSGETSCPRVFETWRAIAARASGWPATGV